MISFPACVKYNKDKMKQHKVILLHTENWNFWWIAARYWIFGEVVFRRTSKESSIVTPGYIVSCGNIDYFCTVSCFTICCGWFVNHLRCIGFFIFFPNLNISMWTSDICNTMYSNGLVLVYIIWKHQKLFRFCCCRCEK